MYIVKELKPLKGTLIPEGDNINKSGLVLSVVTQPIPSFYKDEGGKTHHMVAEVMIVEEDAENVNGRILGKNQIDIGKLEVVPRLCYESGRQVEDESEIFKVLGMEPSFITSTDQKMTIKFRIEKVSRRKDGQRFKLWFDLSYNDKDEDAENENVGNVNKKKISKREIKPVFTAPVCVLSKRKHPPGSSSNNNGTHGGSRRGSNKRQHHNKSSVPRSKCSSTNAGQGKNRKINTSSNNNCTSCKHPHGKESSKLLDAKQKQNQQLIKQQQQQIASNAKLIKEQQLEIQIPYDTDFDHDELGSKLLKLEDNDVSSNLVNKMSNRMEVLESKVLHLTERLIFLEREQQTMESTEYPVLNPLEILNINEDWKVPLKRSRSGEVLFNFGLPSSSLPMGVKVPKNAKAIAAPPAALSF